MSKVQLKDIASFSKGSQINGDKLIKNGAYDYLNGGISPSGKWNEYNVLGDSITISEGGNSCGYVNYMVNPFWCGAHCYYLFDLKCNKKYLYYALKSQQEKIMKLRSGACMPNIKKSDIGNFVFEFDGDINFQKQIAENLDKVTRTIELCNAILEKLDLLVKARFVEMFGDPVDNSNNLPTKTLLELGELGRGVSKYRPRNAPELLGGKYPLIQTGDVANADLYITKYKSTYSEIGYKQSKMWSKNTLCITIAANIAKTAILTFDSCFPDSVVGFNANSMTNNLYIHYWFTFFQAILEAQAPESAQKNINLKILSELEVTVPPIELQIQFADFVTQTDKTKSKVKQTLEKAETLKKALMQEYFR